MLASERVWSWNRPVHAHGFLQRGLLQCAHAHGPERQGRVCERSDEGQGHATSISQLVADELRVPFDDILVVKDTACPYGWVPFEPLFVVGTTAATRCAAAQRENSKRCVYTAAYSRRVTELGEGEIFVRYNPQAVTKGCCTHGLLSILFAGGHGAGLKSPFTIATPTSNLTRRARAGGHVQ
jgi:hypothetical protein